MHYSSFQGALQLCAPQPPVSQCLVSFNGAPRLSIFLSFKGIVDYPRLSLQRGVAMFCRLSSRIIYCVTFYGASRVSAP